jgi:hypothetical protein
MRTPALLLLLLLATACQKPQASPMAATPQAPKPNDAVGTDRAASPAWTAAQQACVERFLEAHALDGFGQPRGTMYPGGTPLFDEATGHRTSRQEYLERRHPEVLRSCEL